MVLVNVSKQTMEDAGGDGDDIKATLFGLILEVKGTRGRDS